MFTKSDSSRDEISKAIKRLAAELQASQAWAAKLAAEKQPTIADSSDGQLSKDDWIHTAEELVATQVVNYLRGVLSFFYGQI